MRTNASFGRRPSRRFGAAALVAVGLGSLAACTGGSGPIVTETPSPTATASASASPSPSATPLTDAELLALMPPDAAFPDVRGAIATAQFFLEQYDDVYATGDLTIWDALSMPDCTFCESVRSTVAAEAAVGDYESGGATSLDLDTVEANYYSNDGYTYVTFAYTQQPGTLFHADGSSETSGDGGTGHISLRMTLKDSIWRVSDVGVDED